METCDSDNYWDKNELMKNVIDEPKTIDLSNARVSDIGSASILPSQNITKRFTEMVTLVSSVTSAHNQENPIRTKVEETEADIKPKASITHNAYSNQMIKSEESSEPLNTKLFEQSSNGNSVIQNASLLATHRDLAVGDKPDVVEETFIYQCPFCIEHFSNDVELIDHCKQHKKEVKCKYCKKRFYYKKDLSYHMRTHYKKEKCRKRKGSTAKFDKKAKLLENRKIYHSGTFKCEVCDRFFLSLKALRAHQGGSMHKQCNFCLEYFASKTTLLRHLNVHLKEPFAKYMCDQCDDAFSTKSLLKSHHRKHALYECELCSTRFRRKSDITRHFKMGCSKGDLFRCLVCEKLFLDEANLKAHLNYHYERNSCAFCAEKFLHPMELSQHLDRHTEIEHPYHCKLCSCSTKYISIRTFNSHLKSHIDQTKFKCDQCCRWFQNRSHLESHSLTHTKHMHKCTICERKFSDKIKLDRHSKCHSGNAFQCDICKQTASTRNSMWKHMKDLHYPTKKCFICEKEFRNQHRLITHLKSHYVKVT